MRISPISTLLFIVFLSATSCISTRKYDEMRLAKEFWEAEADAVDSLRQEYRQLQEECRSSDIQLTSSFQALEQLTATNRNLNRNYQEILDRYNRLLSQNQAVVVSSSEQQQQLQEALAAKQAQLDQRERELIQIETEIRQRENRLSAGSASINPNTYDISGQQQAQAAKVVRILQQQTAQLSQLKAALSQGLRGFSISQLSISERSGKIYVAMSEDLVFAAGAEQISYDGLRAIQQIVGVLKSYPNIHVLVEGHTDTDGSPDSNWDTSVLRAAAVVKAMVENGIDPTRLQAAGRSYFYPIAPNLTAAGKAQNRRVEVILSPDTEILYSAYAN